VKREVGNFIVEEMLTRINDGESPVQGESFNKLSKQYADDEKGGDRTPNLELTGDMLDALTFQINDDNSIDVGIFDESQEGKADGHNHWTQKSPLPKRRFIPKKSQKFDADIRAGVKEIVADYKKAPEKRDEPRITDRQQTPELTQVTLGDILSDRNIDRLFGDIFGTD
jgi:hypothetical protein